MYVKIDGSKCLSEILMQFLIMVLVSFRLATLYIVSLTLYVSPCTISRKIFLPRIYSKFIVLQNIYFKCFPIDIFSYPCLQRCRRQFVNYSIFVYPRPVNLALELHLHVLRKVYFANWRDSLRFLPDERRSFSTLPNESNVLFGALRAIVL